MRKGFFTLDQQRDLTKGVKKTKGCYSCGLHKQCLSPKLFATGEGKKKILIIGKHQSKREDKKARHWLSSPGRLLTKTLKRFKINIDKDCRNINAICCRLPGDRKPKPIEIESCRHNILKEINEYKPTLIIPFGIDATNSLIGHRFVGTIGSIGKWRGWAIPDRDFNCWICPSYHPSFVEENEHNPVAKLIFERDIKNALTLLDKPLPNYKEKIKICKSWKEANKELRELSKLKPPIVAFDYETTGLKPHANGHKIISCAIAWEDYCFAFLNHERIQPLLTSFVTNPHIHKIAANMKFEELWTREILGVKVKNWLFDTMLAAHCLDNRSNITSLKFQAYIRYGIVDYDSSIKPYLTSPKNNANALNKIMKLVKKDPGALLEYNGMDSLLEYRLGIDQMKEMGILDPVNFAKTGVVGGNMPTLKQPRKIKRK